MELENILSQEIIQRLGWTLLHFVWQAAAVAFILAILLAGLRKATANVRYIISSFALGLMVLLPIITMPLVPVSAPTATARIEPPPASAIVPMQPTEEMPLGRVVEYEEPAQLESTKTVPMIPWKQRFVEQLEPALPYLVTGWLIGVFGLSLWHLGGWAQVQRLRRKLTRPVDASLHVKLRQLADKLGVNRAVELLESALVQVPTVIGWLRPMILLPATALTGLTAEQLEALLAHELAHIRRYDYLVNILQTVIETLEFYHPAVWWVSHKIRVERENCCDDLAVSLCGDRVRYARALTSMEEIRSGRAELAVAASGGNLFARIHRLISKETSNNARAGLLPPVITILLIAVIAIPTTLALTGQSEYRSKADIETLLLNGFHENRAKFKCGVLAWSRTTINDGFSTFSAEKFQTKGSFQLWWDGKKIATKYVDERLHTDPTGRRWIEAQTGRNAFDGGLLSRKPRFGQYENWIEQVIRWQGGGSFDNLILMLKKQKNVTINWSIVEIDGSEMFKLMAKNMDEAGTDYGAYTVEYYDPSKGYGLVNQEWYNSDGRPGMRHTVKLQQVIPNGWFPVEVDMKSFHPENGKVTLHNHLSLDLGRCSFNDPSAIPEGIFDLSAAKEHEQLNDILERFSQGAVTDKTDDNVKGPLKSVDDYITAALAGDDEKAAEYAHPESAVAAQTKDTREILQGQDIQILAACVAEWNTLAISSIIQADHGRVGSVVFHLKKVVSDQKVHWLIDDIDLETIDTIEGEIKRFIEKNPQAKTVLFKSKKTVIAPAGPVGDKSDSEAEEKKTWGEPVEGAQIRLLNATPIWGRSDWPHPVVRLRLDARNQGGRFLHLPENGLNWQIEVDSRWYEWVDPRLFSAAPADKEKARASGGSRLLDFNFGDAHANLTVDIAGDWRRIPDGKQEQFGQRRWTGWAPVEDEYGPELIFQSGPHRVRVAVTCPPSRAGVYTPVRLVSNPVELTLSPQPKPVAGDEPAEGRQEDDTRAGIVQVLPVSTKTGENPVHVRIELPVVEVSSDSKMDAKTTSEVRGILEGKITVPESPAVAVLLRQASEATAEIKDESAGDKRVTQEQFDTLFDLLVSRGYVKILMNPTLEVVEGQTAQIKTDQSSLEVTVQAVKENAIDLQVQADLSAPVPVDSNDQTPMFSTRTFSTRVYINSGQSLVVSGTMRPAVPRDSAERPPSATEELLCILTARITTPPANPMSGVVIPKGFDEMATRMKAAKEAGNRPAQQEQQKPEAASRPQPDSMVTRVYDITDLIREPAAHGGISRVIQVHNLITLIQERIAPESWYDLETEGKGTIRSFPVQEPKKLAVHNTVEVHREIKRFLQAVRSGAERIPAQYPRQMTIRGRCIDSDGRPVSDARVVLYSLEDTLALVAESRTYSRGQFRLGPITRPGEEDWGRKSYFVLVPADGHGPAWKTINLYQETIKPLELTVDRSNMVSGSVVTEDSEPVAGAQVCVRGIIPPEATEDPASRANDLFMHTPLPGWSTTTDRDGAFHIAGLPDGARVQLFVSRRDLAASIVHVKPAAPARIELQPGATITGRVLYGKAGKPAAGVMVQVQGVEHISIPGGWITTGGPAVTDEQGRYRLESLYGTKYNVWAEAENLTVIALDSFQATAGQTTEAPDLVLVDGGFIAGRVIDEATGQPVKPGQHSDVAIYGPSRPKSGAAVQSSRIREDGSFRIRVAPGRNYIYLRPMAEWGREKATANPPAHWVEVAQGQSVDVEFKIRKLSQEESEAEARRRGRTISIINVPNTLDELENSAKRLKQLGLAIAMYANEHDDTLPDGLQPLEGYVQEQGLFRWLLENVEYLGEPRTEQPNAARVPIAYDRTLLQQDYSTEVLFLDFSVRLVRPPELRDLGIQLRIRRPTQTEPGEPMVTVDFRNVEIKTIVPKLAEWTGKVIIPTADLMKQKITIHASQKVSRSEAVAMIYNALRSEGYAVEQTDETIFLKPMTGEQSDIGRAKIQIETRILEVTDDFLKENRLDANSVRTREIRLAYPVAELGTEPNSLPYCLVLDDLDVDQLLKAMATPKGKDAKTFTAPKVFASDGQMLTIQRHAVLALSIPSDANNLSDKAQSKPQSVEVGTSIKIVADALPDTNNVLLDCEWELSQVVDFVQRIGPDGKKQKIPVIDRYNMKTTATIPDAKTLLIGGKKIRRWVVTKTKKPLLGDLPLIGSLFHSERKVEETRNILILIKPTVDPKNKAETQAVSPGS